ncbi:hypothetical protein [Robiginitalea sp. SC105]|uniref:hypothetical protein n=1 Tax=Robiginitalea sp. SC105 TaxID=2762332 RepID=UPI00163B303E|nr:hypothetical protein [Robiginitalea sp. SC105]MBC2838543.1 hypothetical protein [Robiginitalea sp. SC105]
MKKVVFTVIAALVLAACGSDDSPKVPQAVSLIYPENNSECTTGISRSETTSEVEFRWEEARYAVRYELTVSNLQTNVTENIITSGINASLVLEKGTAYSWYVVARNQSGQDGPAGTTWQFFNAGSALSYPPFPAQLKNPLSGESVTADENDEIILRWDGADADGDLAGYELYFGTDAAALPLFGALGAAQNSQVVSVASGTVYYWEILSRDAEGNTSRSGVYSFRVL